MLKKYLNRRLIYWNRDKIILNDLRRPTLKNHVNLHWYSLNNSNGLENFGDALSVPIYQYMLQRFGVKEDQEISQTRHLYTIGSILFWGRQDATIWGSGLLTYPPEGVNRSKKFHLDIRAVRGPETREILLKEGFACPEVYGDPALLLPLAYKPENMEKKYDYSVILHKASTEAVENQIPILCKDYRDVVDQIVASKLIISSSLHGIIVAEAYGIPAIMLSDTRDDFNFLKYNDYYFSTGRYEYPVAKSIEDALSLTPVPLPTELDSIRERLMETFPVDLWE